MKLGFTRHGSVSKLAGPQYRPKSCILYSHDGETHKNRYLGWETLSLPTKLLNPPGANACYINSTMLSLLHSCHHLQDTDALLGRMSTIRQAIQQNRRPILLRDMLTFRRLLRDWRAPTQQHDIAMGKFCAVYCLRQYKFLVCSWNCVAGRLLQKPCLTCFFFQAV